jgi:hypothetical protein
MLALKLRLGQYKLQLVGNLAIGDDSLLALPDGCPAVVPPTL